jgi:F-type H+-transporting ATPase subunit b
MLLAARSAPSAKLGERGDFPYVHDRDPMTSHLLSATDSTGLLFAGMSSEGGVTLDFDMTFVLQMVIFAVFVIIMKPLLFEPLMKLFEERERRTEGAKVLARRMDERAGELLRRYESELDAVRRTAAEERDKIRAEAQRLEAKILAEARAEAAKFIDEGKKKLDVEKKTLRSELAQHAPQIAKDIASRVLGREIA